MDEHKRTICFDFDGVCATYDGWKGVDVFGDPIPETAELVRLLKVEGYRVILWTTRKMTPAFIEWLAHHNFNFDSINSCTHNPPETSNKPIAELYIDDRAYKFNPVCAQYHCDQIRLVLGPYKGIKLPSTSAAIAKAEGK